MTALWGSQIRKDWQTPSPASSLASDFFNLWEFSCFLHEDSYIGNPRSHTNGLINYGFNYPLPLWHSSFSSSLSMQTQTAAFVGFVCMNETRACFIKRQWTEKVTQSLSITLLHLHSLIKDRDCPEAYNGRAHKQWGCMRRPPLPCGNFAAQKVMD